MKPPIWEYGHWLVWLCYHLNLKGQKKMLPSSFFMEKIWACTGEHFLAGGFL